MFRIENYRPGRVPRPLILCRGHAPAELHLGHFAMVAGLHPAQILGFQHLMELEMPPAHMKLMIFIFLINFSVDHLLR